ncbi:hypothetical protein STRIP9103_04058 [Streptomyces ipomoeae 91-03]|uniref:Uncharacterized protein n=1 Tax=Streptomyces ipomoeae 91-03 TaxID=698759 RepID=L1L1P6_9ACTN|nr:hypothetical protein STRIP9103_04058 [Streptomyces ipomoeae 91-03]
MTELPPEPRAVPGCDICLGMCVRRDNARSRRDYSAASDVNVELRRHHEEAHGS